MRRKLIIATGNAHKVEEFKGILGEEKYEILSMKDAGIEAEVIEDGKTFMENSFIKARAIYKALKEKGDAAIVVADDSGLVIDALNGEPGIYSSRYLGEDTPYVEKNTIILDRMRDVEEEKRSARFICAIACILEDGREIEAEGSFEGIIGREIRGVNGFGYDPIFFLPERGLSSAELSPSEKNAISHRGKALKKLLNKLNEDKCASFNCK